MVVGPEKRLSEVWSLLLQVAELQKLSHYVINILPETSYLPSLC